MKKTERKEDGAKALLVVRMRGARGARWKTKRTLGQLRLSRRWHATVVRAVPAFRGMLRESGNMLAWGPADAKLVEQLLAKRGRVTGGRPLSAEWLGQHSRFQSLSELAQALTAGDAALADVPGLQPLFRLHPPRGGVASVKRQGLQGALGNRGPAIGELVQSML
jgi:large subunit ribosomal protein L30